jgi:hypothetical protein
MSATTAWALSELANIAPTKFFVSLVMAMPPSWH